MDKRVAYEWTSETLDEHGDIADSNFSEKFPGFPAGGVDVGLVKSVYVKDVEAALNALPLEPGTYELGDCMTLAYRAWAYIAGHTMPIEFDNGDKVPKRFLDEVAKARGEA